MSYNRLLEVQTEDSQDDQELERISAPPLAADPQEIRFTNLGFAYGPKKCLDNVNVTIQPKDDLVIVGESGSGKSTMVKLLLKLLPTANGSISVGGKTLKYLPTKAWRQQCATVMQESILFSGTIQYNITLEEDTTKINWELLETVVEQCCLQPVINELDQGLHYRLGEQGQKLSKGQAQRVMLARALYKDAPYIILDEPTSALDAKTAMTVFQNIRQFCRHKTLIIITHKINIARQMNNIYVLEQGTIVDQGNYDSLMQKRGLFYQLATIK